MTTDKWDGKTRKMLVWFDNCLKIYKEYIVGYSRKGGWVNSDGDKYPHCADIPYYESNEKFSIDYIIKTISERTQDEYWIPFDNCIVEYLKELKELKVENGKLKNGVKELKNSSSYLVYGEMCNEQNKLKEQVKSLRDDRFKMASEVSSAVWKELTNRAKNIDGPVNTTMGGFGFNDISDIVLNKILDYKSENKPNLKVGKWYYCYKDLRIPNAVRSCCVPTAIEGYFVFDGKFFVVPNESLIVDDDYVTYDLNTTIKYEASTFDKIEELREKKPHKINDSWVGECLSNTCVDEDACNEPIIKD